VFDKGLVGGLDGVVKFCHSWRFLLAGGPGVKVRGIPVTCRRKTNYANSLHYRYDPDADR
jgi:hypothetical protein